MNRSTILICLLFLLLPHVTGAQKPVFRVENEEMILRLDRDWNKRTTDSILALFDMSKLSVDSAWRFGSAGQLALDGWLVRKKGKNQIEVYKSTHGSNKIDLIGLPLSFDIQDSLYAAGHEEVLNDFNDREFGYNDFDEPSVYVLNDSMTIFRLEGFKKAQHVYLSGSFNNWSTQAYEMKQDNSGWVFPVQLKPGRHEYKFIVDGRWMPDPMNNLKTPDNAGDYNSVYFKTNCTFSLNGFENARKVVLAGSFNNWDEEGSVMQKIGGKWVLDVFLPDGTYAYKFIVDKNWMTDPFNADIRPDENGNLNSYISLGTPTQFELSGFQNAKSVFVVGSFNNWGQPGNAMFRNDNGWAIPIVVQPGVYDYYFVVDGKRVIHSGMPSRKLFDMPVNFMSVESNYTFELRNYAGAKSVAVTGSFCDWQEPGYPLRLQNGIWRLPIYLPSGKTKYKFIVDGEWILDPANTSWEENEYGTGNSVLWMRE